MYPELVSTLTVDKSGIDIVLNSEPIQGSPLMEDIGIDCHVYNNPYIPDYVVTGYWLKSDTQPSFLVNPDGPHLLYVTGIPKEITNERERDKFRFPDRLHISYWEDNKLGYLFQVISRNQALKHLIYLTSKN